MTFLEELCFYVKFYYKTKSYHSKSLVQKQYYYVKLFFLNSLEQYKGIDEGLKFPAPLPLQILILVVYTSFNLLNNNNNNKEMFFFWEPLIKRKYLLYYNSLGATFCGTYLRVLPLKYFDRL